MAPLSRQLVGAVLPYDTYGTHLNSSRETVDDELEFRNFGKAMLILSSLFENAVVGGYETKCDIVARANIEFENGTFLFWLTYVLADVHFCYV